MARPPAGEEAIDNGDWQLVVRVATDEGLVGWADVETLAPAAAAIIAGQGMAILGFKTLSELLIGENPLDVERLWDKLYVGSAYYGRRGVAMHCISAIDNCLWSIRAEAAGMSLARLLGGRRRDRITAYASTLFRSTPEGMAEAARGYAEKGYRAVKFGWGVFGQDPGRDRELVAAAREALGPDRALLVDPGWYPAGWTEPGPMRSRREAVELCQWLADYDVGWVEDFIHPEHFDEYAYVRERSPVPVAAGEQVATIWEFQRFIGEGCVDVIQPDLSRCGGVSVAKQVARLAEQGRDRPRAPFLADPSAHRLQPAADRHLAARPLCGVQRQPEPAHPRHRPGALRTGRGRHRRHPRHARHRRLGRHRLHRGPSGQLGLPKGRSAALRN